MLFRLGLHPKAHCGAYRAPQALYLVLVVLLNKGSERKIRGKKKKKGRNKEYKKRLGKG